MKISIEGLIGVGKSTFVRHFCNLTSYTPLFESVDDNPFLKKFYENPRRWAFTLQMYFLYDRHKNHCVEGDIILDRSIYGDICFANILKKQGLLDEEEHSSYLDHFKVMERNTYDLDLCIHLHTTTEEALKRINKRDRSFESKISLDYLNLLQEELSNLPKHLSSKTRYVVIPWGQMNEKEIIQSISKIGSTL